MMQPMGRFSRTHSASSPVHDKTVEGGSHDWPEAGQAIVEFALVSVAFFMIIFGTIDFGRAVFMYSELHNAVREGARTAKVSPANTTAIKNKVIANGHGLGLTTSSITVSCTGGCGETATDITVAASSSFSAITQNLLGIRPITLVSSATVVID